MVYIKLSKYDDYNEDATMMCMSCRDVRRTFTNNVNVCVIEKDNDEWYDSWKIRVFYLFVGLDQTFFSIEYRIDKDDD